MFHALGYIFFLQYPHGYPAGVGVITPISIIGEMKPGGHLTHLKLYRMSKSQTKDMNLGLKAKAWTLHCTWLHLGNPRASNEMQIVYCGVKCAVEVGCKGRGL